MPSVRNPKDIAITAKEFLLIMFDPTQTMPCGGEMPDLSWFDDPENNRHMNQIHLMLKEQIEQTRCWKRKMLIAAFTEYRAFEEDDFWTGQFMRQAIRDNPYHFKRQCSPIFQYALASNSMLDLQASHPAFKLRKMSDSIADLNDLIEASVSDKVLFKHFHMLLQYAQQIYPIPKFRKNNSVYIEGSDGLYGSVHHLTTIHRQIQSLLSPVIDELASFFPQQFTWEQLENHKYPMVKVSEYERWLWDDRFYTP